ncbi:MAG TPA: PAS domain S-box protein [Candidatus Binatia bacterium]|nr:PAS domain S-box protein [Candidatus Binatia bacterium]
MDVGGSFTEFLDALPDAIVVSDRGGTITYVNRQAEVLSGYACEELVGRSVDDLVPGGLVSAHAEHRREYVRDSPEPRPLGTRTHMDIRFRRKDGGEVPADISLAPVQTERGLLVVAVVRDLTERRRIEAELRTASERDQLLQERERIGRELHDGTIQSLFGLGLNLQGLAELAGESGQVRRRLEDAVVQIDTVIRDLRDYVFQLRPVAFTARGLGEALGAIAGEFQRETGVAPALDVALQRDDPVLSTHGGDLLQLVREALSNVARHAGARHVDVRVRGTAGGLVLEVVDDGCGFQVDRPPAQGWGLRNLHERAAAMGGRLEIESVPGGGTTVRLSVP